MAHTIPRFIHHPHSPLSVLLPPPTTTPSLFSNHHHTPQGHCAHPLPTLLPHTHTWCGWHVPLWLLSRPVWCVWMACTSHHIVHTHTATTTVALPIATPPLFGVCVDGNTCHMAMPNHQPLTCLAWSSRFLHKCVQSSPLPSTLCVCVVDWWLACVGVATCVSACVLVGCVAFHHTVCRVCLHALIHLCHHTLLLLCCCCWWW